MIIRKRAMACAIALLLAACPCVFSQGGNQLSLLVTPSYLMPFESTPRYFTPGGGAAFALEYQLPVVDFLGFRVDVNGSYLPIWTGDGTAFFSVGGGPSIFLPKLGGLTNSLFGTAGYYYGIIADSRNQAGGNFYLSGGLRSGWEISPSWNMGIELAYRAASDGMGGFLYQGLNIGLSARYTLLQASPVRIRDLQFIDVFPVLFKYYDANPIGKVIFENGGTAPIKDLEVSFFVDKYMDNPTQCPTPPVLNGGQKVTIDLFALFSEKVLSITESTVVSGKVTVAYTQEKKRFTVERSGSLYVKDRNAVTWDDDRKVAAFVMYKDPAVLEIAKSLAHTVKESSPSIDVNLSTAMALHEALRQYGMSYVVDPTSSYAVQSKNKVTVDYIQYPRSTLQYKSGDCDDLSVLYASILQGVGIDTAFVTVPGHIYVAFALKMSSAQAKKLITNPSSLISFEDRTWIPVEITMATSDFLEAWNTGAAEWRDNEKAAGFIPVAKAWEVYEPIGYFEDTRPVSFLPETSLKTAFEKELALFTDRELANHKERLDKAAEGSSNKSASLNSLGVLCAQFGRGQKAKEYFGQGLQKGDFYPALINFGNILYLEKDFPRALTYYLRAQKLKPDDASLALHLSQIYGKMGNSKEAEAAYRRLASLDPALAARHSYLDTAQSGGARAAEQVSERETMLWQE